eukprot:g64547.t1
MGCAPSATAKYYRTFACFFEISIGDKKVGRIEFELRGDVAPLTCENFRQLCTGERGYGYKGAPIHHVLPAQCLVGGDFENKNGTGGQSIWGGTFKDENFKLKHSKAGVLSMKNSGPNTNGSQFIITLAPTPDLDGRNVVFGEVTKGLKLCKRIMTRYGPKDEDGNSIEGPPRKPVIISDCGEAVSLDYDLLKCL